MDSKAINTARDARTEALRRLRDNRRINDAEFAYSPSTCAVGIRWEDCQSFRVFNIYYPMYGRSELVTDWRSVGKGEGIVTRTVIATRPMPTRDIAAGDTLTVVAALDAGWARCYLVQVQTGALVWVAASAVTKGE